MVRQTIPDTNYPISKIIFVQVVLGSTFLQPKMSVATSLSLGLVV